MTVHTGAETIQGRKLFKGGNYSRIYGIHSTYLGTGRARHRRRHMNVCGKIKITGFHRLTWLRRYDGELIDSEN